MAQRMENLTLDRLPVGTEEDKALTLAFQRGSKGAYQQIHDRYRDRVQRVCRRMLPNPQDAQDATQETFLRVYQALGRFNGRYQLGPWITRIATNVCLDHIRAKSRRPQDVLPIDIFELEPRNGTEIEGPDSIVIRRSEGRRVRKVLASLPPLHRAAIVLRDFEGLSYQEVAAALELSECQVKALIHRARQGFKRSWTSRALGGLLPARLFHRPRKLPTPEANAGHSSSVQQIAETFTASAAPAASSCTAALGHCGQFVVDKFAPALTAVAIGVASLVVPAQAERTAPSEHAGDHQAEKVETRRLAMATDGDSDRVHRSVEAAEQASLVEPLLSDQSLMADVAAAVEAGEVPATTDSTVPPPQPIPSPTATPAPPAAESSPSPGEQPTPVPPEQAPHPSGFSFSFAWDGVFSGRSCQCLGPTVVQSERASVSDEGSIWFEQSLTGTGSAAGSEAFRVDLDHRVQSGQHATQLRLYTAEGSYVYSVSTAYTDQQRTPWGGWSYTYSGSYSLGSRPSRSESVPESGTYVVVVDASPSQQRLVAVRISLSESR